MRGNSLRSVRKVSGVGAAIRRNLDDLAAERRKVGDLLESKRLALTAAQQDVERAQTSFRAWATTRQVT
ncbi:hypothetical protein BSFA1_59640 [Burkholderia sp. SFA1]|nr:hypothetical protein BSFA1_59640 [Burkholderia sp. SFA1]